ncbi:hypothetical protein T484DRAFT_1948153 [Baffinella frigidus]|nr:hypothetical protein T484DRAFT_1948153 [Cryptophyta sp. CCMP2293]
MSSVPFNQKNGGRSTSPGSSPSSATGTDEKGGGRGGGGAHSLWGLSRMRTMQATPTLASPPFSANSTAAPSPPVCAEPLALEPAPGSGQPNP